MSINKDVVLGNLGVREADISDAAHVRGQAVNMVDLTTGCKKTVVVPPQVKNFELIRVGWFVVGILEVNATYPMALMFQTVYQVMADEASGPSYNSSQLLRHVFFLFLL